MFATRYGTELDAANIRRAFRSVAAAAGLEASEWTPRELRHMAPAGSGDNIDEPQALRRMNGSSMYNVAGADLYTSTWLRQLNNPTAWLLQAVQRYTDGLRVTAEQLLRPQTVAELDQADQCISGLTTEPAWPTLRAHLLALAAETGTHPLRHMLTAASGRDLSLAGVMAAILYWRLTTLTPTNPAPLPWLPGIPPTLHAHPVWRAYLAKRSQLVLDLAAQVQDHARQGDAPPVWAAPGTHPSTALIGEIAVWRAANGIQPQEPRPPGGGDHLETAPRCGNNVSTGISLVPPIHQLTRGLTNGRQHTPHLVAGTTTASARTKHPVHVKNGSAAPGRYPRREHTGTHRDGRPPRCLALGPLQHRRVLVS